MNAKQLKRAKHFSGLLKMLVDLPADALISGRTAPRVYDMPSGPWNADLVDHVHSEVQRFIDSMSISEGDQAFVRWNRANTRWAMGDYERAISDAEIVLEIYERAPGKPPATIAHVRKALALMRERRGPMEMLDE